MTIVSLGSLTVGGAVPGASVAVTSGVSGINQALPDITAKLAALTAFVPAPVSLAAQFTLATQTLASINLAIASGLPVPSIATQIATVTALVATLTAEIAAVNAQLSVLIALQTPLAHAGVSAYAYDGAIGSLGSELGAAVGGGGTHANALALVTTDPTAWAAMGQILKVTP